MNYTKIVALILIAVGFASAPKAESARFGIDGRKLWKKECTREAIQVGQIFTMTVGLEPNRSEWIIKEPLDQKLILMNTDIVLKEWIEYENPWVLGGTLMNGVQTFYFQAIQAGQVKITFISNLDNNKTELEEVIIDIV